MDKKLKIMTILGTRPEIIRLSRVIPTFDQFFDHIFVYTNQNYDKQLSTIFFEELKLRDPNYFLQVKADTLGDQIGKILSQSEKILLEEKPDALLVLGDTNSALSAIMAKRHKILIFHMEAGNRSFDWDVPEEINRRIVDHISDYNLAYTEHSRRYLLSEGMSPDSVIVTGTPLAEVFAYYKKEIEQSTIVKDLKLKRKKYFLVSMHREENVDKKENLIELSNSINTISEKYSLPVIISLHPRTAKRIQEMNIVFSSNVKLCKPFGYFDYNNLQKNSLCVLSDSGTIQEEASLLRFSAVQIRKSTERPEGFDSGSVILTGFKKEAIIQSIEIVIKNNLDNFLLPQDYHDSSVSLKVTKFIQGMTSINKSKLKR